MKQSSKLQGTNRATIRPGLHWRSTVLIAISDGSTGYITVTTSCFNITCYMYYVRQLIKNKEVYHCPGWNFKLVLFTASVYPLTVGESCSISSTSTSETTYKLSEEVSICFCMSRLCVDLHNLCTLNSTSLLEVSWVLSMCVLPLVAILRHISPLPTTNSLLSIAPRRTCSKKVTTVTDWIVNINFVAFADDPVPT